MKVSYSQKEIVVRFEEDDTDIAKRTLMRLFGARRGEMMFQRILEARSKSRALHVN